MAYVGVRLGVRLGDGMGLDVAVGLSVAVGVNVGAKVRVGDTVVLGTLVRVAAVVGVTVIAETPAVFSCPDNTPVVPVSVLLIVLHAAVTRMRITAMIIPTIILQKDVEVFKNCTLDRLYNHLFSHPMPSFCIRGL
jgi:hypothetical protein